MFYDKKFLLDLNAQSNRVLYARITSLNMEELPLETIEGRITSGSLSFDGNSSVRRTCSLSMVSEQINISNYYWSLNTKFKLEIGIQNSINKQYPDIIWISQGIFLISSFSTSYTTNNLTIGINGKDKMCRLNGEIGGVFNSSVDFGNIEEIDKKGNFKKVQYPVKDIIREMVHQYGGEPFHKIIINDLEEKGLAMQEYIYEEPLYLYRKAGYDSKQDYENGTLNSQQEIAYYDENKNLQNDVISSDKIIYESLSEGLNDSFAITPTEIYFYGENAEDLIGPYYITKIEQGQVAGYMEMDLIYPDSLVANVGETITSILDKIKKFLGNFEYFYDIDGNFVFQMKKDWVNSTWNPIKTQDNNSYVENVGLESPYSYEFNDTKFFTTFNNSPNLGNLKNDYTVWGTNTNNLPIHMRYAIDEKPRQYTSISVKDIELKEYNQKYGFTLLGQDSITYIASDFYEVNQEENIVYCDWREIIYQMGRDYRKYNHLDDFEIRVSKANPELYSYGKTGYEQYYIDLEAFWRQLYNPEELQYKKVYIDSFEEGKQYYVENQNLYIKLENISNLEHQKIYIQDEESKEYIQVLPYEIDIENNDIQYYLKSEEYILAESFEKEKQYYVIDDQFYYPGSELNKSQLYWNKNILEAPENLLFWFDFLDLDGDLNKYSVKAIGPRQKASNDNTVKAIQYREIPYIIFEKWDNEKKSYKTGYRYFNLNSDYANLFSRSTQGKSAKEAIDTLLYNHGYCIESVSITSVPIYDLELNTRIYINDIKSGIEGDYIVSKYTLPLTYNGTMSITATKAAQRLL